MRKRLGHQEQMYMPVFVEECSMGMCSCWVHCMCILCQVPLIAGVGYRVEQWSGKWDGMMGVANLCNWHSCSRLC